MGRKGMQNLSWGIFLSPYAPTVTALLRTWLWLGQISPPLTMMEGALPGLRPHQWMANVFLH